MIEHVIEYGIVFMLGVIVGIISNIVNRRRKIRKLAHGFESLW